MYQLPGIVIASGMAVVVSVSAINLANAVTAEDLDRDSCNQRSQRGKAQINIRDFLKTYREAAIALIPAQEQAAESPSDSGYQKQHQ